MIHNAKVNNLMLHTKIPRALLANPRAEANPAKVLSDLNAAVTDFRANVDTRISAIEAAVNANLLDSAMDRMGAGGSLGPVDASYTEAFNRYFRKGDAEADLKEANAQGHRAQVQAAMSVGDNSSGGYLAPVEWDRKIQKAQTATSPMRRLATVQTTSVGAYTTLWDNNVWGSGWVGEAAARPETTTPSLSSITFGHGEIYAMPAITQRLLDDSGIQIEAWLAGELETEFNKQENIAFLSGNGTNKPFGLLQYIPGGAAATQHPAGTLGITPTGNATTIPNTDVLIDFFYSLTSPYRQNATWLMNSQTAATVSKFKDVDGNYIWREGLLVGQPASLLGRPVEIDEGMPSIGAGNYAIAFGDFKAGYLINDRLGTRILRDPYSNKPYVLFYSTKRVGAGVLDPNAIRLLKIAVS
ncbi:MAG: phage major capsid protein [Sphingopyxis sp.]|nr:phage major capsid protein [Sphingopyxis sp.]